MLINAIWGSAVWGAIAWAADDDGSGGDNLPFIGASLGVSMVPGSTVHDSITLGAVTDVLLLEREHETLPARMGVSMSARLAASEHITIGADVGAAVRTKFPQPSPSGSSGGWFARGWFEYEFLMTLLSADTDRGDDARGRKV